MQMQNCFFIVNPPWNAVLLTFPRSSTSFSFTAHNRASTHRKITTRRGISPLASTPSERAYKAVNAVPFLPGVSSSRYIYGEAIIINRVASVLLGFTTGTRHTFARKLARNVERTYGRAGPRGQYRAHLSTADRSRRFISMGTNHYR